VDAETEREITFAEICEKSEKLCKVLASQGITYGDVVAICSENNLDYFWIVLGVLRVGASCALLSPTYTASKFHIITAMLCTSKVADQNVSSKCKLRVNKRNRQCSHFDLKVVYSYSHILQSNLIIFRKTILWISSVIANILHCMKYCQSFIKSAHLDSYYRLYLYYIYIKR
jgi:acyl-CoA synthetase (AMP-forming)/AMP-acid ligase II